MRRPALIALGLLAACREEPDFDRRYQQAQERIERQAAGMERALATPQASESSPPEPRTRD